MTLTTEERQLKEAMKILLRDGKEGRLYGKAAERFLALYSEDRINNMGHEMDGVDLTLEFTRDAETIKNMIGA